MKHCKKEYSKNKINIVILFVVFVVQRVGMCQCVLFVHQKSLEGTQVNFILFAENLYTPYIYVYDEIVLMNDF